MVKKFTKFTLVDIYSIMVLSVYISFIRTMFGIKLILPNGMEVKRQVLTLF